MKALKKIVLSALFSFFVMVPSVLLAEQVVEQSLGSVKEERNLRADKAFCIKFARDNRDFIKRIHKDHRQSIFVSMPDNPYKQVKLKYKSVSSNLKFLQNACMVDLGHKVNMRGTVDFYYLEPAGAS